MHQNGVVPAAELLELIEKSRNYTERLLARASEDDWFRMPAGGITHLAWQMGHLAFAEYRLALERIRGTRSDDEGLLPAAYSRLFGRLSVPQADPAHYPSISEIRRVFDAVHRQVQVEAIGYEQCVLDSAPESPHREFTSRRGAMIWCAQHEMLHAGQIGLLLRLLGKSPDW